MGNKTSREAKPVISPQDILAERVKNEEIQKKQLQDEYDQLRIKHSNLIAYYKSLQEEVGDGSNLRERYEKKLGMVEGNLQSNFMLLDIQNDLMKEKTEIIREKEKKIKELEAKLNELMLKQNTQERVYTLENDDLGEIKNKIGYYKKITYLLCSIIIAYSVYRIIVKSR